MNNYNYPELIKDCKCITCIGCSRLELLEFKGVYRCNNYAKGVEDDQGRRNINRDEKLI